MPKVAQQIGGKVGIRTQGRTLASHPGLIPQLLVAAPNPWGTFIYRIPPALRGYQNYPAVHGIPGSCPVAGGRIVKAGWAQRRGHWWQLQPRAGGLMPPAPDTGPALLIFQPLPQNLCGGPAPDTTQFWTCFMGISSSRRLDGALGKKES